MREIKFRAWMKNKERMLGWESYPLDIMLAAVEPEERFTVMQYTGLKDKNGKEIYEGDVIFESDMPYTVLWLEEYASFGLQDKDDTIVSLDGLEGCEVIGNIYENKELLK